MFSKRKGISPKKLISFKGADEETKKNYVDNKKGEALKTCLADFSKLIDGLGTQQIFNVKVPQRIDILRVNLYRTQKGHKEIATDAITKKLSAAKIRLSDCIQEFKESPDVDMEAITLLVEQLQGYLSDLKAKCLYSVSQELTDDMRSEIQVLLDSAIQECAGIQTKGSYAEADYQPPAPR